MLCMAGNLYPSHHSHLPGHAFAWNVTSMLICPVAMHVTSMQNLMSQITCDEACARTNSITIQLWKMCTISLLSTDY